MLPEDHLATLSVRRLQQEAGLALSVLPADSASLSKYAKEAPHNSSRWYRAVIIDYIGSFGGLPSKMGPASKLSLVAGPLVD